MKRLFPILLLVCSFGVGAAEKYCYDLERSNALVTFGNCRGTEAEISKKEFETLKVCKFEARCAPSRLVKKEAVQESPKQVVQESTKTVINTKDSKIAGTGTGFFINGDGYIVTNSHVIKGCASLTAVQDSDSLDTKVIFDDPRNDLALLKVDRQPKVFATFRGGRGIRTAEDILALGYPFQALLSDDLKITKGMVNSLAGLGNDTRMMQISAPVQPGNSGGPLLDHAGNVVGVVTSKMDAVKMVKHTGDVPQNINFALKASLVRDMLEVKSIDYETASSKKERQAVDIFDQARQYTVLIECRGEGVAAEVVEDRQKAYCYRAGRELYYSPTTGVCESGDRSITKEEFATQSAKPKLLRILGWCVTKTAHGRYPLRATYGNLNNGPTCKTMNSETTVVWQAGADSSVWVKRSKEMNQNCSSIKWCKKNAHWFTSEVVAKQFQKRMRAERSKKRKSGETKLRLCKLGWNKSEFLTACDCENKGGKAYHPRTEVRIRCSD